MIEINKIMLLYCIILLGFMSTASAECIKGDCVDGFGTYIYDSTSKDKTEYYVIDKVTGKKHRMYLEDEYDLTEPRKKEEE